MIQRGKRTSLLLEAGESVRILREEVGQDLDRDGTMELRVVARDRPRPCRRRRGMTRFGSGPAGCLATVALRCRGCDYRRRHQTIRHRRVRQAASRGSPQTGIMLAGRVEIRLSRGPLERAAAAKTRLMSGHLPGSMSGPCVNAPYLPRNQCSSGRDPEPHQPPAVWAASEVDLVSKRVGQHVHLVAGPG